MIRADREIQPTARARIDTDKRHLCMRTAIAAIGQLWAMILVGW